MSRRKKSSSQANGRLNDRLGPGWLKCLLDQAHTTAFALCQHENRKTRGNMKRFFCIQCRSFECQYCADEEHVSHVVLQVRKAGPKLSTTREQLQLLLDMTDVKVWSFNRDEIYNLEGNALTADVSLMKADPGACIACNRRPKVPDESDNSLFCSILCKQFSIFHGVAPEGSTLSLPAESQACLDELHWPWASRCKSKRARAAAGSSSRQQIDRPASAAAAKRRKLDLDDDEDDEDEDFEYEHQEDEDDEPRTKPPVYSRAFIDSIEVEQAYILGLWGKPLQLQLP